MTSDRRIANTRDGEPVWFRLRRGARGGAHAARRRPYSGLAARQNAGSARASDLGVRERDHRQEADGDLDQVDGAFFYAASGETVWPELPGEERLLEVLGTVPE